MKAKQSLSVLVGVALLALLVSATSWLPKQPSAAAGWIHKSAQLEAGDELLVSCTLTLTDALARVENPTVTVRLLDVDVQAKVGQICLKHQGHLQGVALDRRDPIKLVVDPVNLKNAAYFAAKVLGESSETEPAEYSSTYEITIAPAPNLAWGAVASANDLVISLAEAAQQR